MYRKAVNILILITILIPIAILMIWAFSARWPWPQVFPRNFSLRGFENLMRQPNQLLTLILSSVFISSCVAMLSCMIALMTARAMVMAKGFFKNFIQLTIALPFLIPVIVFATGIHQKMIEWGWANKLCGVIFVHLIYSLPYASYLVIDAYHAVGLHLEEQAWILGANKWKAFWKITFPLLLPVLATSLAMSFIVSFSQYFLTLMIGGGKIQTLSVIIYPYLQRNDRTIASIYALFFLIISFLVMGLFSWFSKYYQRKYEKVDFY
ncbi:ABC transporter permease [Facklamia sp. 7083-14-GEN3]|uniref:ABC transporter permease n=1 Tax=Facklamia sp. 7083-14-GEN3 TaxID=2973478 RepID=UPI00215D5878|nr:ABC transporter permease subunit [Facklamia sp. 7083-14-GEN3]MCR8968564.1 ABC transporter permease subunit [Facklamia sp. 7083-14-GEN3]